jgi:hypothetical protein
LFVIATLLQERYRTFEHGDLLLGIQASDRTPHCYIWRCRGKHKQQIETSVVHTYLCGVGLLTGSVGTRNVISPSNGLSRVEGKSGYLFLVSPLRDDDS